MGGCLKKGGGLEPPYELFATWKVKDSIELRTFLEVLTKFKNSNSSLL